jgi:hypothetical protein
MRKLTLSATMALAVLALSASSAYGYLAVPSPATLPTQVQNATLGIPCPPVTVSGGTVSGGCILRDVTTPLHRLPGAPGGGTICGHITIGRLHVDRYGKFTAANVTAACPGASLTVTRCDPAVGTGWWASSGYWSDELYDKPWAGMFLRSTTGDRGAYLPICLSYQGQGSPTVYTDAVQLSFGADGVPSGSSPFVRMHSWDYASPSQWNLPTTNPWSYNEATSTPITIVWPA